ncbi:hypothetical protein A6B43_00175 [Vespertiliibacter pulmonis]|uniref:Uncharacterized protein n=1 Tax=Vespertiliibacter pulmonis TaxID=1443036 RepID=A0A3N4VXT0_9PAST|nr:hypothetical protein [Vespertiliibacter pulmonis]QLB20062.1 hypothetical protein A6B43_00175 [Vespertiliibacter pulmonis]RPE86025.1 hypothetical protein EDC46_0416 [Vespertiliibacter pulmonis]
MKNLKISCVLAVICFSFFASTAMSKPIKTFDQAIEKVMQSVVKNKLTYLPLSCLSFIASDENAQSYSVDVLEKHNAKCGGDPTVAPRLMSYEVNKKAGTLCTDSIEWAKHLNATDPYDFSCRAIK